MHVVDEFTRESLADLVAYSIDADATVTALGKVAASRGFPEFIRCEHGPELTATCAGRLCQLHRARLPVGEPVGGALRQSHDALLEAQLLVADWRREYNTYRPHSALGVLTPAEFVAQWRQASQPQLS